MILEPFKQGDRVRCVDEVVSMGRLTLGKEYSIESVDSEGRLFLCDDLGDDGTRWLARRFKPIVRVKAPTRPGCCNKACDGCKDFAFRARLHRFATSGDALP